MAPLIGKDMSEAIFLERFAALCVDPLFHVRKVCAANFGDFSNVVGAESTEETLVSSFLFKNISVEWVIAIILTLGIFAVVQFKLNCKL